MKKAIKIKNLYKNYASFEALKGIDLEVAKGDVFGFLGPNGSGKTTTIRCLLDLIHPNKGEIEVFGINPQKNPVAVKEKLGYLPGELNLDETQSARKCLHFFSSLRHSSVDWKWVENTAKKLKLNLDTKIKNFSKGNKQKVGIIQAFMHQPELLILDEPTSGLDPLMQKKVLEMVCEAKNRGATIFFSSHILSEVEEVSDKLAIIRDGKIIDTATTSKLISKNILDVVVTFEKPFDIGVIKDLAILKKIQLSQQKVEVQIEGNLGPFIQKIAPFGIQHFQTSKPSLEEIFLAYYN